MHVAPGRQHSRVAQQVAARRRPGVAAVEGTQKRRQLVVFGEQAVGAGELIEERERLVVGR
jgi:hypothetical protein